MSKILFKTNDVNNQIALLYTKLHATEKNSPTEIRALYQKAYDELEKADSDAIK